MGWRRWVVAALLSGPGMVPAVAEDAGASLARAAVERLRESMKAADAYTYDVRQLEEKLDGDGRVTATKTRDFEIFFVDGRPIQRPVAEDGVRFDARKQASEDRDVDKKVREARRQAAEPDDASELPAVLARFDFRIIGREEVHGRSTTVLAATPLPGKRDVEADHVLRRLAGKLWVDEVEGHLARVELKNTGSIKFGWGLLASLSEVDVRFEFARLDDGAWLPARVETLGVGRFLLVKGFRQRTTRSYSGYRRFGVESEERLELPGAVPAPSPSPPASGQS